MQRMFGSRSARGSEHDDAASFSELASVGLLADGGVDELSAPLESPSGAPAASGPPFQGAAAAEHAPPPPLSQYGGGGQIVALCPHCRTTLAVPADTPYASCPACSQLFTLHAVSSSGTAGVPPGAGHGAGAGPDALSGGVEGAAGDGGGSADGRTTSVMPPPTPPPGRGPVVTCPHCSTLLYQPLGHATANCGTCHNLICFQNVAPPAPMAVQCPRCHTSVVPPPGAPLVKCGACMQMLQIG